MKIELPDAECESYGMSSNGFTVVVRKWNDRKAIFRFSETVGVRDVGVRDLTLMDEVPESAFLDSVLDSTYVNRPDDHPYRTFAFFDLDDQPVLQIVATDVVVEEK